MCNHNNHLSEAQEQCLRLNEGDVYSFSKCILVIFLRLDIRIECSAPQELSPLDKCSKGF